MNDGTESVTSSNETVHIKHDGKVREVVDELDPVKFPYPPECKHCWIFHDLFTPAAGSWEPIEKVPTCTRVLLLAKSGLIISGIVLESDLHSVKRKWIKFAILNMPDGEGEADAQR